MNRAIVRKLLARAKLKIKTIGTRDNDWNITTKSHTDFEP